MNSVWSRWPSFWKNGSHSRKRSGLSAIATLSAAAFRAALTPLSLVFGSLSTLRANGYFSKLPPAKAVVPTVFIGGVTLGGSGKTPITAAIAAALHKEGNCSVIFSRGYGGDDQREVVKLNRDVDGYCHDPFRFGDEAVLLSQVSDVVVCAGRRKGYTAFVDSTKRRAVCSMATFVSLFDDGLHCPEIEKTVSLLVIDNHSGVGNGLCLPAGPLREPLKRCLERVDAIVSLSYPLGTDDGKKWRDEVLRTRKRVFEVEMKTTLVPSPSLKKASAALPVVAVSGIANNDKFLAAFTFCTGTDLSTAATARSFSTVELKGSCSFPDHYRYSIDDLKAVERVCERSGASSLLTTEKDWVKIRRIMRELHWESRFPWYRVQVTAQLPPELASFVLSKIRAESATRRELLQGLSSAAAAKNKA